MSLNHRERKHDWNFLIDTAAKDTSERTGESKASSLSRLATVNSLRVGNLVP